MMTIRVLAERLAMHPNSLRRLIRQGKLPATCVNRGVSGRRTWRVSEDAVKRWLDSNSYVGEDLNAVQTAS